MGNEEFSHTSESEGEKMTLDDGILRIYSVEDVSEKGMKPVWKLKFKTRAYFGFETVGITRHYAAMRAGNKIAALVRVWQDRNICADDICILEDGAQYRCSFVQHMKNDDGLDITKITLERLEKDYGIV